MLLLVAQSCQTLCDPINCSPPGPIHGILLAGILEWVARPSSRGSSQPKNWTRLPHCRWILYCLNHQGSPRILEWVAYPFFKGASRPRNRTRVSCIAGRFFIGWATRGARVLNTCLLIFSPVLDSFLIYVSRSVSAKWSKGTLCTSSEFFCMHRSPLTQVLCPTNLSCLGSCLRQEGKFDPCYYMLVTNKVNGVYF